jgi:hypothetical protein
LEEEIGAAGGDRKIADLVDDEQARAAVEAELVLRKTWVPVQDGSR